MSKRKNKEIAGKAALKRRLIDIAQGAYGAYEPLDFEWEEFAGMASEMGLDAFGRWLGGIKNALLLGGDEHLIAPHNLEHYDSIDKAVEFLWRQGIRT